MFVPQLLFAGTLAPSINNSAAKQTSKGDSTEVFFFLLGFAMVCNINFGSSPLQNNANNVSFRISTNCKPSCYYIQCWVVASLSSQQLDWPAKSHHNPPVPCPSISPFMCSSMSSPLTRAPSQQLEGAVFTRKWQIWGPVRAVCVSVYMHTRIGEGEFFSSYKNGLTEFVTTVAIHTVVMT